MASLWNCACLQKEDKQVLAYALDILRAQTKTLLERIEKKELVGATYYTEEFQTLAKRDLELSQKLLEEVKGTLECKRED